MLLKCPFTVLRGYFYLSLTIIRPHCLVSLLSVCFFLLLFLRSCNFAFLYSARDLVTKSREALLAELENKPNVDRQMLVLQELLKREGEDFQTSEGTIKETISSLYQKAAYDRKWSAVRRGAGLLKKLVDSLAPGITTILVSGKVVRWNS